MGALPNEVHEALNTPSYSLLVRGLPGTGKTRLALSLLSLEDEKDGVYVSTRVDARRLLDQYPTLATIIENGSMIDATETSSRGSEPIDIISRIRFRNLPDFAEALQSVLFRDGGSRLVVIDSWELIPKRTDSGPEIAAAVIDMCAQTGSRLVLVSESSEESYGELENIVDGILDLRDDEVEGRTLRRLVLRKLRGIDITRPAVIFTLMPDPDTGATFRTIQSWSAIPIEEDQKKSLLFSQLQAPEGFTSTGISDLDRMMQGGLPLGSTTLIEVSDQVSQRTIEALLIPIWLNTLLSGRNLSVLVSPSFRPTDIRSWIESFVDPSVVEFRLREVSELVSNSESGAKVMTSRAITEWERNMAVNTTLSLSADGMERFYPKNGIPTMLASLVKKVSELGNVLLVTARPSCTCIVDIRDLARVHLRLIARDNTPILYGVKPHTPLYGIEEDRENGSPQPRLIRIS